MYAPLSSMTYLQRSTRERGSCIRRILEVFRRSSGAPFRGHSHRRTFSRVNDWGKNGIGGSA